MLGIRDYVMPDPGFYGALYNLWYTTDQLNGANGNTISSVTIPANHAPGRPSATLKLDVSVDLYALAPTFMWVSDWKPLRAKDAAYVVPTFATTSVSAAIATETGRGLNPSTSSIGVGDMYVQPLWLDWTLEHFDVAIGGASMRPQGNTTSRRVTCPALVRSRVSRPTTSASASGPRRAVVVNFHAFQEFAATDRFQGEAFGLNMAKKF